MNLPSSNHQNNHTLAESNTPLLWDNETVSYGLETTNTTSSNEQQLGTISNELWLDESVDTSQFGIEDSYSELVFIDSAVPDSQTLIDNISGATDVVLLDESVNEIVQISEHLSDYQQLDTIHIVSLGESGELSFANTELNFDTLAQYDNLLQSWRNSLDVDGDLILYGCDVAFGKEGNSFVRQLSRTTGADVLASVDKTGIEGDWELETAIGEIETGSIFSPEIATTYQYTLDTPDVIFTETVTFESTDYFGTDISDNGFNFDEVDASDLSLLPGADIDGDGERFDYSDLNSDNIAEIDYQNISADDLGTITEEEGLSFEEIKAEDFAELDINNIPTENHEIIDDSGLDLSDYDTETLAGVELGVVATFGYIDEAVFQINSLSENTTFGELSNLIQANANLYDYKGESLNLDDGFSLSETEQLDFNDYKALDFAFNGDEIFNSSYYLQQNPDVAEDGINPFTQYFLSGAYNPEFRDPSTFFDSSYYLQNNSDVASDGINPLFQYFNSGALAPEFRDPDPAFDTSFYLKQNPKVAESGINPLFHYFNSGASEGRFANSVFKNLEEIGEALVTSLDIDGEDFDNFKETALSLLETRQQDTEVNTAGVALPIIPILVKIGEVILATYITKKAIDTSDDIRELLQQSNSFDNDNVSGSSNVFVFPNDDRLTQGEILTFPEGEFDVDFGSEPFDLGEPIGFDDNTFFPKGDGFLDDILNGRFEFPDEGERGSYFLAIEGESFPTLSGTEYEALIGTGLSSTEISQQIGLLGDIYVFRGTSEGFPGNPALERLGISPASVDPLVATVFAVESNTRGGNGIVLYGSQEGFGNPSIELGNVRRTLEREVSVGLTPTDFAAAAPNSITVDQAREILKEIGFDIPATLDSDAARQFLEETPKLSPEQVQEFVTKAASLQ